MLLAALVVHQAFVVLREHTERLRRFRYARQEADAAGKPLLVVGGPYGSMGLRSRLRIPAHGHGDVCLDLEPGSCGEPHYAYGDVREIPFATGHFGAVFCSHVLEHLHTPEDCDMAVSELYRVADVAYICVPAWDSMAAWLSPQHRLRVDVKDGEITARQMRSPRPLRG